MARQTALKFTGTVDGVIYYERLGGYYMRSKPARVRQTNASKSSAAIFGQANRLGKLLRQLLAPLLPNPADRKLMHRFTGALQQWLAGGTVSNPGWQPVQQLQHLELNSDCSLLQRCKPLMTVQWQQEGSAVLHLPAMNPVTAIAAPAGTTAVQLDIMAVACCVSNTAVQVAHQHSIEFDYINAELPAQEIPFTFTPAAGNLLLVNAALRYRVQGAYCTNKKWQPAIVVDAVYTGA